GVAPFFYVQVAAGEFQWRIRLHAGNRWHVGFHKEGGNHFDDTSYQDGDKGEHSKQYGLSLQHRMPVATYYLFLFQRRRFRLFFGSKFSLSHRFEEVDDHDHYT